MIKMKHLSIFLVYLFLTSCTKGHSPDADHFTFENPDDANNLSKFELATNVIKNRCINCHSGYHNFWENYKTENDWVNEPPPRFGSVIPRDPDNSAIIYRLSTWGSGGEMNMPESQPSLSEEEYLILVNWINSIDI